MKKVFLLTLFTMLSCSGFAAAYYSRASGLAFNSNSLWSDSRGGSTVTYPGTAHSYVIQNGHSVNFSGNIEAVVNFTSASSANIPALDYYDLNLTGGARVLANSGIIGIASVFTPGGGRLYGNWQYSGT